ncbi:MAG: metal-dependent hydrolase [Desulfobacteraceae bacterium]|nr:metal-dependent hydrolase [Desulfobacteraceae bacterium]
MTDNEVTVAYFGGAAFKITTPGGKRILIDPYIAENQLCHKSLEYFYDADLILVSHGAFDHMGDAIEIMRESKAILICGGDVAKHSLQMDIPRERVRTAIYGGQEEFEGIRIKIVYARHQSTVLSGSGDILYYGVPMGFVINTENDIRIYHTGDTSLFGDLRLVGMLYSPNILLIGISNVGEGYPTEMDPREAALATLWVAPDVVVPMHYPPGSDDPAKFREAVKIVAPNVESIIIEPNSQITYGRFRLKTNGSA